MFSWIIASVGILVLVAAMTAARYILRSHPGDDVLILKIIGGGAMNSQSIAERSEGKLRRLQLDQALDDMRRRGLIDAFQLVGATRQTSPEIIYYPTSQGKAFLAKFRDDDD